MAELSDSDIRHSPARRRRRHPHTITNVHFWASINVRPRDISDHDISIGRCPTVIMGYRRSVPVSGGNLPQGYTLNLRVFHEA